MEGQIFKNNWIIDKIHEVVSKAFSKFIIDIYLGIFLSFLNFMRPYIILIIFLVYLYDLHVKQDLSEFIILLKFVSFNQLYIHIPFYI